MNLREIILGIAIFVLTMFVATYGVNMIYSSPVYEDFCHPPVLNIGDLNESECMDLNGKWVGFDNQENFDKLVKKGYCDVTFNCQREYESARESYSKNLFLIAVPLGILLILFGAYFFILDAVGVGIMAGGVGTLLRGIGSYWRYSEDWIRFLISLIGLGIMIHFSYKFKDLFGLKVHKKSVGKKKKKK